MKNRRIRFRLVSLVVILMLISTGIYGIYSVTVYGTRYTASSHNVRTRNARKSVIPGDILDRNNIMIAGSDSEGNRIYQTDLLSRASLVHLLGDEDGNVANTVEAFQAEYLQGMKAGFLEQLMPALTGQTRKGDTVKLTVDSRLCTHIVSTWRNASATAGKCGAVVVMNYQTGEILALVSLPVYDPCNITDQVKNSSQYPFWNRATQSLMPPGSTFKIITTAAALDNIKGVTERTFTCNGALEVEDQTITDYGNEVHEELSLKQAFTKSCNNVFAQLALEMGDAKLRGTAEKFGFNDNTLFRDLVVENSSYPTSNRGQRQIAWSGVGQSAIAATPLQMCMVGAAIANGGVMMEPCLVSEIRTAAGQLRESRNSREYRTACTEAVAETIENYMLATVSGGTGTRAQVSGLKIAGKTGSAESTLNGKAVTHAWFVGYIANSSLPYAACVFVEEGGSGGKVAAPVAQSVFTYLKNNY